MREILNIAPQRIIEPPIELWRPTVIYWGTIIQWGVLFVQVSYLKLIRENSSIKPHFYWLGSILELPGPFQV